MRYAMHSSKLLGRGPIKDTFIDAPSWSVFLNRRFCLLRPARVPQRVPRKGEGVLAAKRGQDQRIVCACCRRLRPRLRSVSSRLTVCARCYRCVLDKPTEVGAVAKGIQPRVLGLIGRRPTTRTHTNLPHGNRPFGKCRIKSRGVSRAENGLSLSRFPFARRKNNILRRSLTRLPCPQFQIAISVNVMLN